MRNENVISADELEGVEIPFRNVSIGVVIEMTRIFGGKQLAYIQKDFSISMSKAPDDIPQDEVDNLFAVYCAGVLRENQLKLRQWEKQRAHFIYALICWSLVVFCASVFSHRVLHALGLV